MTSVGAMLDASAVVSAAVRATGVVRGADDSPAAPSMTGRRTTMVCAIAAAYASSDGAAAPAAFSAVESFGAGLATGLRTTTVFAMAAA
ncbi:hypothetical protein SDC9_204159 [bioreactor metagenome]|uniref:Uncharacterized protein n=1 Tax=bioreactor metagenome TaxID=1076179 RepID=A0A645J184_9ZZZZ